MTAGGRAQATILHVDMDAFFVSVELLDQPRLLGLPVVVSQGSGRAVVASASYEARRYGVRSAMPVARARRLCPRLVIIPPVFEKYRAASRTVMAICSEFTPLVEQLSIDEAFLDVGGATRLFGAPAEIAALLRARLRERTGLPASVGLAGTKFVAKLASQRAKPDGLLEIAPDRTLEFLHPLPIDAVWGVGAATAARLRARALHTVGDLARESVESLRGAVGAANAQRLHELANGTDARKVVTDRIEKSVGHEETFAHDVTDVDAIERELLRLATRTGERLRAKGLRARTVAIKLRWSDFTTITRSRTLPEATNATMRLFQTSRELLASALIPGRAVRLIGVRGEQLVPGGGLADGLWNEDEEWIAVDAAGDAVRERFGRAGLVPARLLGPTEAGGAPEG